jgi:hypothetical protein
MENFGSKEKEKISQIYVITKANGKKFEGEYSTLYNIW